MKISNDHYSVMASEMISNLDVKKDGIYVDCTMGRGGHTSLILERLNSEGKIIAIDQDDDAINYCIDKFKESPNVKIIKGNFEDLKAIMDELDICCVDGIIFDLGVSSPQLDNDERGFSYRHDGPLDMRMDQSQKLDAKTIINKYSNKELYYIFKRYGDIKSPNSVIRNIVEARDVKPITTTMELVEIIKKSVPTRLLYAAKHPARLYFQAIRIAVNNEIDILEKTINDASGLLKQNGKIIMISFHSLEDKIIKRSFTKLAADNIPKEVPTIDRTTKFSIITKRPILPNVDELKENNRSRSSKLRILIKN